MIALRVQTRAIGGGRGLILLTCASPIRDQGLLKLQRLLAAPEVPSSASFRSARGLEYQAEVRCTLIPLANPAPETPSGDARAIDLQAVVAWPHSRPREQ